MNSPESTLHSKVPPASVEVNEMVGVESLMVLPSTGPSVIEVSGGVVSGGPLTDTVKLRLAGEASALLLGSVE